MNRNLSYPTDNKTCRNIEELKELFTDPAIRKTKNSDNAKTKKKADGESSVSHDIEASTSSVKVLSPAQTANSLMTRRITIAGGFLDIALFSANCEQLKFVLEMGYFHIYYKYVLGLLVLSMVLQLLVGVTMFLLGCQIFQRMADETYANVLNQITMGLVSIITIVNIFISTFGPKGSAIARCIGAFAYPNTSGPLWMAYLNATRNYMTDEDIY